MKILRYIKLAREVLFSAGITLISLLLTFFSILLIWLNKARFPLVVPLWFSKPWGEDWLAAPSFLWIIPALSLLVILLNLVLARFLWERKDPLSFLLIGSSGVVSGLLFYSLLRIILVVS